MVALSSLDRTTQDMHQSLLNISSKFSSCVRMVNSHFIFLFCYTCTLAFKLHTFLMCYLTNRSPLICSCQISFCSSQSIPLRSLYTQKASQWQLVNPQPLLLRQLEMIFGLSGRRMALICLRMADIMALTLTLCIL